MGKIQYRFPQRTRPAIDLSATPTHVQVEQMIEKRIIPGMHLAVSLYGLYQVVSYFKLTPMYVGGAIFLPVAAFCFFSAMVYAEMPKRYRNFEMVGIASLVITVGFIAWTFNTLLGIGYTALTLLNAVVVVWRLRRIRTSNRGHKQ
jgi:hypothetical protein